MATGIQQTPLFTRLELPLSDTCNLSCAFCYTCGGCGKAYDQEHVDASFGWFFKQLEAGKDRLKTPNISCSIYGGEPLVEYAHIKELVPKYRAVANSKGFKFKFSIVSNVTLLTEDKLEWLKANNVSVSCSIDGCPEAQDYFRKYKSGLGSSEQVYRAARLILADGKGHSCRMTVAPETAPLMAESIRFVCEDLGFSMANMILAGGVTWTDKDLAIIEEQSEKVTDWWIDNMRNGKHYSVYHLRNMLSKLWNPVRNTTLCSSGKTAVAVDTAGNLSPCHRFANPSTDASYILGNIRDGVTNLELWKKIRDFRITPYLTDKCLSCPAITACHALCMHEMMLAKNGMFTPLPHYCKIWPVYWRQAVKAHNILMFENNSKYKATYGSALLGATRCKSCGQPIRQAKRSGGCSFNG